LQDYVAPNGAWQILLSRVYKELTPAALQNGFVHLGLAFFLSAKVVSDEYAGASPQ
jgi:hypothetical protein